MTSENFEYNALARFFAAMFLSEPWYERWNLNTGIGSKSPLYCKTRAIVLFDRVICDRLSEIENVR